MHVLLYRQVRYYPVGVSEDHDSLMRELCVISLRTTYSLLLLLSPLASLAKRGVRSVCEQAFDRVVQEHML